jgi:membrane protein insertase Oxa1/YidC/SpoIIIJ
MSYLLDCVAGPSRHAGHALRSLARAPIRPRTVPRSTTGTALSLSPSFPSRRHQSTSTPIVIDTISTTTEPSILDPLVNLLLSSPLPAWATIIGLTICVRTSVTLPVTLWQRGRMMTEAREVRPRMKVINERLAVALAKECREQGLGYEEYKKQLKAKVCVQGCPWLMIACN